MPKPILFAIVAVFAYVSHWTATVLPMVGTGPVRMPGFMAVVLAVLLATAWLVFRLMVVRPVREAQAQRAAYIRGVWSQ